MKPISPIFFCMTLLTVATLPAVAAVALPGNEPVRVAVPPGPGGALAPPARLILPGGGPCPEGKEHSGDLGIGRFVCLGGSCMVNEPLAGGGYAHRFSTEPRVEAIDPGGPSAGKLHEGDVIVAVDGALVTTREGGRRLAELTPGRPIELRVRRDGRELEVSLTPATGCNLPGLIVRGAGLPILAGGAGLPTSAPGVLPPGVGPILPGVGAMPPGRGPMLAPGVNPVLIGPRPAPAAPRIDFGLELDCTDCGWRREADGELTWHAAEPPVVRSVEAGGPAAAAGVLAGDVLLAIDGHPLTGEAAARLLAGLEPGQSAILEVGRNGLTLSLSIVPRSRRPQL